MTQPQLRWDIGTAYDLFVSLNVLHNPADYGVRSAWAAGVRARLPTEERETLNQAQTLLFLAPLYWVHDLPHPKDSATVLWALGRIPSADRLPALSFSPEIPQSVRDVLQKVIARGSWDDRDKKAVQAYTRTLEECTLSPKALTQFLTGWSRAEEFGERYLQALHTYYEVFFAEEEKRLRPALEAALARAQDLAKRSALPDLLENLSQGLRFAELPQVDELVLAPSFWSTPLVFLGKASAGRAIWLFGAKPADVSLVPGEVVPDALLRTLKALSDPTRLRVLHYLAEETLTPAQLSRRLRLRIPTVTHHLNTLRLAGLVHLTVEEGTGREKEPYTIRFEAVEAAFALLKSFLLGEKG